MPYTFASSDSVVTGVSAATTSSSTETAADVPSSAVSQIATSDSSSEDSSAPSRSVTASQSSDGGLTIAPPYTDGPSLGTSGGIIVTPGGPNTAAPISTSTPAYPSAVTEESSPDASTFTAAAEDSKTISTAATGSFGDPSTVTQGGSPTDPITSVTLVVTEPPSISITTFVTGGSLVTT